MSQNAENLVQDYIREALDAKEQFFKENTTLVVEVGKTMARALAGGRKILYCGNGGSAADAQHMAAELVNRFLMERPPLPAIALTTDTSILTAIGNDYGFEQVFQKQVHALGRPGDVLIAISTSGNSENVKLALETAREKRLITVGITGGGGGTMPELCDFLFHVKCKTTPVIQEVHTAIGHLLCRLTDYFLFEAVTELGLDDGNTPGF